MPSEQHEYFNPSTHLVYLANKNGEMMSGGYTIHNTLFENNIPLYFTGGDKSRHGMSGSGIDNISRFSDLFTDLAVPAGLFIMPPLYNPRTIQTSDNVPSALKNGGNNNNDNDDDDDAQNGGDGGAPVIAESLYDKLLSLVSPDKRIMHDITTRRRKVSTQKKRITRRRK
jgi:hypothetical protein